MRACTSVSYFCQKKKSLPIHLPLCLELILPPLAEFLRIILKKKRKETYHVIFFWESDPGRQTPAVRGIRPVFGRGIWERECSGNQECVFLRVCVCVRMGEAVIILVCAVGRAGALLWHATLLHSICNNQNKNTPGVHEASQAQPGHKPS